MSLFITLLICGIIFITPIVFAAKPIPQVMLASSKILSTLPVNTSGYYVSEKYDGVRAYWTGSQFLTRQGYHINAPEWFIANFPATPLDGELWIARNRFDDVSAAVRRYEPNHDEWRLIKYMVFDLPKKNLAFYQRQELLKEEITDSTPNWLIPIKHTVFNSKEDMEAYFNEVVKGKGEGIMLNVGNATYKSGRSNALIKVKPIFDQDAIVTGYQPGKGKYKGYMGALWVKNNKGQVFKIGSGFSDKVRKSPPLLGSVISYQHSGISKNGLPRFPRFIRVRSDL